MTTAYRISSVRSASGELKVWRTILNSLKGMRNRLLKIQTFITRHYIILTSLLYRVRTLTSHNTEESENSPESTHFGKIDEASVRSDKAGAFRASNTHLVELDDPSMTLEGPSLTLNHLPIESVMRYTRSTGSRVNAHHPTCAIRIT